MVYLVTEFVGMYSGAAVVALDLAESLGVSGRETGVVYLGQKIPDKRSAKKSDFSLFKMPYYPIKEKYPKGFKGTIKYKLKYAESCLLHERLRQQFKSNVPELMIFNDYVPSTVEMFNRYGDQHKTVFIVHVSPTYIKNYYNKISLSEILDTFSKADALVFVSDEGRKEWLTYSELSGQKMFYVPNCADEQTAHFLLKKSKSDIRQGLNMKPDRFYLTSVASLQPRKGQDLLVDAAPAIRKIAPNLEILIIGGGKGEYTKRLKEKTERQNLNYVKFLGKRSNSMEYIRASDAFILPSRAEALPLVILEAMVLKTPVLASNIDGVPEMIKDRQTGLLFESDSTDSLINRFGELYRNETGRQQVTAKASDKYWDYFSNRHFTNRYIKMIDELKI